MLTMFVEHGIITHILGLHVTSSFPKIQTTSVKSHQSYYFHQRWEGVNLYLSTTFQLQNMLRLKPSPNGLASRRKLKTWVYLRLRLARACVHLRWLAMACAHFGRNQFCTQVKASFSPFGHPTQVKASWVTSINGLLANEIQDMSALKCFFFCDSRVLVRKLASAFGHPTQISTQVQLAPTCDYLPVRLTRA